VAWVPAIVPEARLRHNAGMTSLLPDLRRHLLGEHL
jgi:hypothetical protein